MPSANSDGKIDQAVVDAANRLRCLHALFLERYPFHVDRKRIDHLSPNDVYGATDKESFLLWVEYKLRDLGKATRSDLAAREAKQDLALFKKLLKATMDPSKSIAEKVDAGWHLMKGWGGDRQLAKKIIHLYNPTSTLPIYSTDDIRHFLGQLGVNIDDECIRHHGCRFEARILSPGKKYELLTKLLLREKAKRFDSDNLTFAVYLYDRNGRDRRS